MTCIVSSQNKWQSYDGAERGSIVPAFRMLLSLQTYWLPGINYAQYVLPAPRTMARQIPYFSVLWHWKASNCSVWLTLHWLSLLWLCGSVQSDYTVALGSRACLQVSLLSGRQKLFFTAVTVVIFGETVQRITSNVTEKLSNLVLLMLFHT